MGPAVSVSWLVDGTKEKPQHVAGRNEGFIPVFSRTLNGPFNALGKQLIDGRNLDGERCPQSCPRHRKMGALALGFVPGVTGDRM